MNQQVTIRFKTDKAETKLNQLKEAVKLGIISEEKGLDLLSKIDDLVSITNDMENGTYEMDLNIPAEMQELINNIKNN